MKYHFWKMHGAGNDFILLDDRPACFPRHDPALIRRLCDRRTGIGSEGLLLIQSSRRAHCRMRFFNPDGREAAMCGNGARCLARLACDLGAAPPKMQIETAAGLVEAEVLAKAVRIKIGNPTDCRCHQNLSLHGETVRYHAIDTGVPHVVVETEALDSVEVGRLGAAIRQHAAFAPAGANVNFMTITGPQDLRARTYERGVEAETLSCGTGITACALIAGRLGRVRPPVRVRCRHGDTLEVNYRLTAEGFEDVTLLGPSAYVFKGQVTIAPRPRKPRARSRRPSRPRAGNLRIPAPR
ncbi:MAG: diaminopimelate epimerase [Lentisphaerae bacterium]|nr:diaminopimelate epimerase [Lentisphaerota bacterium]